MGKVVHFEIPFDDKQRAMKFYTDAFDWKLDRHAADELRDGRARYRWRHSPQGGGRDQRRALSATQGSAKHAVYVGVDRSSALKKVAAGGGKVVTPKTPIPASARSHASPTPRATSSDCSRPRDRGSASAACARPAHAAERGMQPDVFSKVGFHLRHACRLARAVVTVGHAVAPNRLYSRVQACGCGRQIPVPSAMMAQTPGSSSQNSPAAHGKPARPPHTAPSPPVFLQAPSCSLDTPAALRTQSLS